MPPMKPAAPTVHDGAVVYLDPEHGLRLPPAEQLADRGVVTNSQIAAGAGAALPAAPGDLEQLERSGLISRPSP